MTTFYLVGPDFAHGRVAGALAGAPHVPTGDGAVGTPAFAEFQEFFGRGHVFLAVGHGPALLYAEVVDREHVGTTEAENQKHFDSPGADAADGDEPLNEFVVGEQESLVVCGDDAFDGFLGEILHGGNFCAGEAGIAEFGVGNSQHFFGARRAPAFPEGFDTREDGGGGFAGDGLVGDGFEENFVGRLCISNIDFEGCDFGDEAFQAFIALAEMANGFGKIESEIGYGCVDGHGGRKP